MAHETNQSQGPRHTMKLSPKHGKIYKQKNWSSSSPPTKHLAWKKVQRKLHDKETDINASEEEP